MAGTLTVSRANLSLGNLVFGADASTGFVLSPGLSFGTIDWRKTYPPSPANVAGRQMIDCVREASVIEGAVDLYAVSETDLQDKIGEVITALTQVDATAGFQTFTVTFAHGTALYRATVTEPGTVTPGADGVFDDEQMDGYFMQSLGFVLPRDPIPLLGPI